MISKENAQKHQKFPGEAGRGFRKRENMRYLERDLHERLREGLRKSLDERAEKSSASDQAQQFLI